MSLSPVELHIRKNIESAGTPARYLTFVETGMASVTTLFHDGSEVEVGMFGYDSVVGLSALLGSSPGLNRVYMQIAGYGYRCSIAHAGDEFERGGAFRSLVLQCLHVQLLQAMRSAGCNVKHTVEQRLARWLLLCADHIEQPSFVMPHVFLADMLGSSRTTITAAANCLRRDGLIHYSRGKVEIVDVGGLEARACECYLVMKGYLQGFVAIPKG